MDFDTQVKLALYNHFAATGIAPSPGDVAASMGTGVENVLESDQRIRVQRLLVLQAAHNRWQRKRAFQGMQTLHLLLFCSMIA